MTVSTLLDSWQIVHYDPVDPADEGYRCFTCPKCGGAGKLTGDSDRFGFECKCTKDSPTGQAFFNEAELA